jgi:hypothetical protein
MSKKYLTDEELSKLSSKEQEEFIKNSDLCAGEVTDFKE